MKKVLVVFAFVLSATIAYHVISWLGVPEFPKFEALGNLVPSVEKSKKEVPVQTSWVDEPWEHSVVLNREVRVESPFPLHPGDGLTFKRSNPYVKAYDLTKGSKDAIYIEAGLIVAREDAMYDVRRGMKAVMDYLKADELTEVTEKLEDGRMMGRPACEFTIKGKHKAHPVQGHGILFTSGRNGVIVWVRGDGRDERIPVVWKRLKSGIRDANATATPVKTSNGGNVSGMESGSPGVPPGFTPRNLGTKEKSK